MPAQKRERSTHLCECGCGEYTFKARSNNVSYGYRLGEPLKYISGHNARGSSKYKGLGCNVDGCTRPAKILYMCASHWQRYSIHGDVQADKPIRVDAKRGEGSITPSGYRIFKNNGKAKSEHRMVVESAIGRPLLASEKIHHIDGDKLNNNIENLEIWSNHHPKGQRVKDQLVWAEEIVQLYDPAWRLEDE